jgi:hypothetical protein
MEPRLHHATDARATSIPTNDDDLINKGVIINRRIGSPVTGGRTFIVTGLHRSGTSLVASVLRHAGIFMGQQINDAVFEDEEMLAILREGDTGRLQRLIRGRNTNYGTWGFKAPLAYTHLQPEQLALFDNAHLIVMFRDIASIAVRNSLSEYREPMAALREAVTQLDALVTFIGTASASSLLLSYEKALLFPGDFVDTLMQFAGLPSNPVLRTRLAGLVEPNRREYITHARRIYQGRVDGVVGGHLLGWCQLLGSNEPVQLEVFIGDRLAKSFLAEVFRQDLLDARIGNGAHGFVVELASLRAKPNAIIRVRVAGRPIELDNSGQRLARYRITPA